MAYFDNHIHRPVCEVYLQVALNLMGEANTEEPFNLEGKALEDYNVSSFLNGTLEQFPVQVGWFAKLVLAYYFGNYEIAEEMASRYEDTNAAEWPLVWAVPHPYFRALAYLAMARKLKSAKGNVKAKSSSSLFLFSRQVPESERGYDR